MQSGMEEMTFSVPAGIEVAKKKGSSNRSGKSGGDCGDVSDVPATFTLTWTKNVYKVKLCPDGRQCRFCLHRDSEHDPISFSVGIIEQMWWYYPPKPDGTTVSNTCGVCGRIYDATAKPRGLSLTQYEDEIAEGGDTALNKLRAMGQVLIKIFSEKGGSRRAHVAWSQCEQKALALIKIMEMNVKRPGWTWKGLAHYNNTEGDLRTNGKDKLGHRFFVLEGKEGVFIPDADEVKIDFNEKIQSVLSQEVQRSSDLDLSNDQLENNMCGSARKFFDAGDGSFDGVSKLMLTDDGLAEAAKASPKAPNSLAGKTLPKNASPMKSASSAGKAPTPPSMATPGFGGLQELRTPPPPSQSSHEIVPAQEPLKAKAQSPKEAKPKKASAKASKETRGRKPKDLCGELDKLVDKLVGSKPDDPILFGAEAKIGRRPFEDLNKAIGLRIKKETEESDLIQWRSMLKATNAYHTVLAAIDEHGLASTEFKEAFDMQTVSCNLSPTANLRWPSHVLWARHKLDIGAMTDNEIWLRMVSSEEMRKREVADEAQQQRVLLAEKIASFMKVDSMEACVEV